MCTCVFAYNIQGDSFVGKQVLEMENNTHGPGNRFGRTLQVSYEYIVSSDKGKYKNGRFVRLKSKKKLHRFWYIKKTNFFSL